MKKFFTLICALVATVAANAGSIDDVAICKHSQVFIMDDISTNGTVKPAKYSVVGDGFILLAGSDANKSVATNKQKVNPAGKTVVKDAEGTVTDEYYTYGEAFATKYAEYAGDHLNSLRLKNGQDQFAIKMTAGSKLIILGQTHSSRYPTIALAESDNNGKNEPLEGEYGRVISNTVSTNGYFEWQALQDVTIYVGSFGGDWYFGMVIVEANEAAGTPSVKASAQQYDGDTGMWYSEVTCKPVAEVEGIPTCCTYTLDGTEPTAESPVYTEPIKVYKNCVVKFQAFYDYDGVGSADDIITDATNDAIVTFKFDAPTITSNGANVTIEAAENGATNYYSINGGEWIEGSEITLEESANVTAMSKYENGEDEEGNLIVFESKTTSKDVYVLTPVTEKTVITVSGQAVVDQEATALDPNGNTIYKVENGSISADKAHFYVKELVLAAVPEAEYQIDGQQAYIQMSNTTIDFELIEPAAVTVICSKNSAKNLDTDKQCKITVDGSTYGGEDVTGTWELLDPASGEVVETLPGNVVKFDLAEGHHQFKKYSGTGAIKIASITIEPGASVFTAAKVVAADNAAAEVTKTVENGKVVIVKNGKKFTAAGAQIK